MEQEETAEYLEARNQEWARWARTGEPSPVPETWLPGYAVVKDPDKLWNTDTWPEQQRRKACLEAEWAMEMRNRDQAASMQPPVGEVSGAEIVSKAHALITGDRNSSYGHPYDDYLRVTETFAALTGIQLTPPQAIIFMDVLKLSRLVSNLEKEVWHEDSAVDAVGYVGVLSMAVHKMRSLGRKLWRDA